MLGRPLAWATVRSQARRLREAFALANEAHHRGDPEAEAMLRQLLAEHPDHERARQRLASVLMARANAAYRAEAPEAAGLLREVLAVDPAHVKARAKLAAVLLRPATQAFRDGAPEAAALLRQVLEVDPGVAKARGRLAALVNAEGRAALEEGDQDRYLALLREAHALRPGGKQSTRLSRALRTAAASALAASDFAAARAHLREASGLDGSPLPVSQLAALDVLPLAPRAGLPAAGTLTDLVLVEAGTDPMFTQAFLSAFPDAEVFGDRRLPHVDLPHPPTSLLDLGTVGMRDDHELCAQTDRLGARVRDAAREALPRRLREAGGVDVLEHLSFEFDDHAFTVGKKVRALERLLLSGRYGRLIVLVGDGRLHRCVLALARRQLGPEVHFLWCSLVQQRYAGSATGEQPTPVPLPSPLPALLGTAKDRARSVRGLPRERAAAAPEAGSAPLERPVAVLTSASAQHVSNVAPVVAQLLPGTPVVGLVLPPRRKHVEAMAAMLRVGEDHPDAFRVDERFVRPSVSSLRDQLGVARAVRRTRRRLAVGGMPLGEADLWPLLEPALHRIVTQRLPLMRAHAADLDAFLTEVRPRSMVIAPDRFAAGRLAATLARRAGVPTLFPQVGYFSRSPRYKPLQTDYIAAMDQGTRELYLGHFGAADDQVLVTGLPRFDPLLAHRSAQPAPQDRPPTVVLILQRFSLEESRQLIDLVAGPVAALPGVRLVVKMHPGDAPENAAAYRLMLDAYAAADRFSVTATPDLYALLAGCDLVVSVFSTVVVEAAMLERLVLCVNTTGEPLPVPVVEEGVAVAATSAEEVARSLADLLTPSPRRDAAMARQRTYLSVNGHLLDDQPASARIARLLEDLPVRGGAGRVSHGERAAASRSS